MRGGRLKGTLLGTGLVGLMVLAGCGSRETFTLPQDSMVGKPAPLFSFHNVHKRGFPSTNFLGKTLVVVLIRPGQPELPGLLRELENLHRHPSFAAAQFMALSPEDDPLTEPYWVGLKIGLPVALDFTDVARKFGASPSHPMIVVIDYKGKMRLRLDGYVGSQFRPRFKATRKLILEVEEERTRPATAP